MASNNIFQATYIYSEWERIDRISFPVVAME